MNMTKEMYQQWIEENLDYMLEMKKEIEFWQKNYNHRVFEEKWPDSIKKVIESFKADITKNLSDCKTYITRIEEGRKLYDEAYQRQFNENMGNDQRAGIEPSDPNQEPAWIKQ